MRIVSVVGARPQFIKAAPMSRALRRQHTEILVHTGQHYDDSMSGVFFRELGIPEPEVDLGAGSGSHAEQTARMLVGIEQVLLREKPDWLLIYGDTNSTLAGALAAAKLHVPIVHVEAGLRSFNRRMPEEINRIIADQLAALRLCSSQVGVDHLAREGITGGVHVVGDVMADALLGARERGAREIDIGAKFGLRPQAYILATVHRAENTDVPARLRAIFTTLENSDVPVVVPVHPRTRKALDALAWRASAPVRLIEPLGYLDMIAVAGQARAILTDSGGLQKEAYWLQVPCITMRAETEWTETVDTGWNTLVDADPVRIARALAESRRPATHPVLYGGDGHAAERCVALLGAQPAKAEAHAAGQGKRGT